MDRAGTSANSSSRGSHELRPGRARGARFDGGSSRTGQRVGCDQLDVRAARDRTQG
jgi:hypothetical protein